MSRTAILNHLSGHFKKDAYEKQGGAHAYWLKPTKGASIDEVHKMLTDGGVKANIHEGIGSGPKYITGKHGQHGFEIQPQGRSLHVRFHRTKEDSLGIDSDQYEEQEDDEKLLSLPGHVTEQFAEQIVSENRFVRKQS